MEGKDIDTLEQLLAEIRALREGVERGEVDRTTFGARSANLQSRGSALGVDFSQQLQELRQLGQFDLDLSGVINQLRQLDEIARSGSLTRAEFDERAQRIRSAPIISEQGEGGTVDSEIDRIRGGADFAGADPGSIAEVAGSFFLFNEAIEKLGGALSGLINPFRTAIQLSEEFNSNVLKSQILFVSSTRAFDEQGKEIFSATDRLKQSNKDFIELNKNLEIATQSIAGLTTARLTSVTREVTKNLNLIQGQSQQFTESLEIIENLVPSIAGALSTLGLPELQDTQEIRELLRGQFNDQRALLGVQLGISKQEADLARSQGRFVDLLLERLQPFVEGNRIASEQLGNILVNFQDSQEILARSFAEQFAPPLVEAANNLFKALVIGGEQDQTQTEINNLLKLNSLSSQRLSIEKQLADTSGLSAGQVKELERTLEAANEQFEKLPENIRALEGTDTSEAIIELKKELAGLDPTPVEEFQSFLEDLGAELGSLVNITVQQLTILSTVLNAAGLSETIVGAGEKIILTLATINRILGFTTAQVQKVIDAFETLGAVDPDSLKAVEDGIRGSNDNIQQSLDESVDKTNEVRSSFLDLIKTAAIVKGLGLVAGGFAFIATAIATNFGPLAVFIASLKSIPAIAAIIAPLVAGFGLLATIISGVGVALTVLAGAFVVKEVIDEIRGVNKVSQEFIEINRRGVLKFGQSAKKVREDLAAVAKSTDNDARKLARTRAQLEIDAIRDQIKAKEDSLKSDQEITKELEGQGKTEEEIEKILKNRINVSNQDKRVRESTKEDLELLRIEEEGIAKAAADANIQLKDTSTIAKGLKDQGLISTKALQDFDKSIDSIIEGSVAPGEAVQDAISTAISSADILVRNGLRPASEVSARLVELAQETTTTTEQRKEILNAIIAVGEAELEIVNQRLDSENKILQLKAEAGLIGVADLNREQALNRIDKAEETLASKRLTLKRQEAALANEELKDSEAIRKARLDVAEAEAESVAARTNLRAVEAAEEANALRDRITQAENFNKRLSADRKRAAIEQGKFFEAQELELRNQFDLQSASVEAAEEQIKATQIEIEGTSDVNKLKQLNAKLDTQITQLATTRLEVIEQEEETIRKIAELEGQRIRNERQSTIELRLQAGLAQGAVGFTEERLKAQEAITNFLDESRTLDGLIREGTQDDVAFDKQREKFFETATSARKAILGLAKQEADAVTRLGLEQDVRDGLITQAEADLELAFKKEDATKAAIVEAEKLIKLLQAEGLPTAKEDTLIAELKLELLKDQENLIKSNIKLIEDELGLQKQVSSAGERVLGAQQQLLNKISQQISKQSSEALSKAEGSLSATQSIIKELEAGELDEKARLQAIRELGRIDPVAAAQAAQGRFEAVADTIRRKEEEIAKIKSDAAKEEGDLAEKRLKIEQAIEAIKLQSRLAEIQLEKAKADNIEDPQVREDTLKALQAEENLIGVQQQFLEDPDSVDLDDIGNVFDVQDIDVSDVTRRVRSDNDEIRSTEQQSQAAAFKPLFESVERIDSDVQKIFDALNQADFSPDVTVQVNPGTTDPNLNTAVIRGEN